MFFFMASYLLFWKFFGDIIHEKFKKKKKKQKNAQKTSLSSAVTWIAFLAWKMLKFGFLYFYKSYRNWIFFQKTSITNQLEFWAASYGQNTKQVQKITQIQHYLQFSLKISNGDQHQICSSLSNRLIISLCFKRKFFLKNKLDKKQIPSMKKFKNAQKNVIIFTSNLKRIFDLENVEIWFSLFLKNL